MQPSLKKYALPQHLLNSCVERNFRQQAKPYIKRNFQRITQVPVLLAVIAQTIALFALLAMVKLISLLAITYFNDVINYPFFLLVCMQALMASLVSYSLGMASWWRVIHFIFPLAVWLMCLWQVPNQIYLAGLILSLSVFWSTFRSQVPFFPSRPIVWQRLAKLMPQARSVRLIDIGSGLGDVAMHIAKLRPDSQIEGIEVAPLPWLVSYLRAKLQRSNAIFKLGDYRSLNFAHYDVIFAYLSPVAMPALWQKASQEMRSGSLLISLEFDIPGVASSLRIAGSKNSPMLYVWKLP